MRPELPGIKLTTYRTQGSPREHGNLQSSAGTETSDKPPSSAMSQYFSPPSQFRPAARLPHHEKTTDQKTLGADRRHSAQEEFLGINFRSAPRSGRVPRELHRSRVVRAPARATPPHWPRRTVSRRTDSLWWCQSRGRQTRDIPCRGRRTQTACPRSAPLPRDASNPPDNTG